MGPVGNKWAKQSPLPDLPRAEPSQPAALLDALQPQAPPTPQADAAPPTPQADADAAGVYGPPGGSPSEAMAWGADAHGDLSSADLRNSPATP
eukprot:2878283-Alexandrium_andersonii.AAC.1